MRIKHKNRLYKILFFLVVISSASALIFSSLNDNLLYFYTPSQLAKNPTASNQKIKLGGLVKTGSVVKSENDLKVRFTLTDMEETIDVLYVGILPDLFREMQGVIVDGKFINKTFIAESVLAKHDENYMPAELARELGYSEQFIKEKQQSTQGNNTYNYSPPNQSSEY